MITINLCLENRVGILDKITNVLTRNRVDLVQLFLEANAVQHTTHVNISVEINTDEAHKLLKQFQ